MLIVLIFISTCKKSNDTDSQTTDKGNNISYKLDGVAKQASGTSVTSSYTDQNTSAATLVVSGTAGNEVISLTIYTPKLGTLDVNKDGIALIYSLGSNNVYRATSGTVVISSLTSSSVSGTFQGSVISLNDKTTTKAVTDGQFTISSIGLNR